MKSSKISKIDFFFIIYPNLKSIFFLSYNFYPLGQSIEPTCYVPVIPMALVNGSDGIGTGKKSIPNF